MKSRFTLLEIVIALLLLVLLVGTLMFASSSVSSAWRRSFKRDIIFSELISLENLFNTVVANSVPFLWKDEDNHKISLFKGNKDSFSTVYIHKVNNLKDGGIRFISFVLEKDEFCAYYRERPVLDFDSPPDDTMRSVIARRVDSIELQYAEFDKDNELEWSDEWDEERTDIPVAIWLTIRWTGNRTEQFLSRTAGNSKYERLGKWKAYQRKD